MNALTSTRAFGVLSLRGASEHCYCCAPLASPIAADLRSPCVLSLNWLQAAACPTARGFASVRICRRVVRRHEGDNVGIQRRITDGLLKCRRIRSGATVPPQPPSCGARGRIPAAVVEALITIRRR